MKEAVEEVGKELGREYPLVIGGERVIVDAKVYDAFLEKLKARVVKIKVGPPTDPETFMGPVINASSKKSIQEYIEAGKREGRLITGGGEAAGPGHYLEPTVIADVPP
jgi:1-pyrroline-5-carboxylate dehydrogenase